MQIFNNKVDLNLYLSNANTSNGSIGFVPTMGALHAGHLSLLKKSVENNAFTVISIFVNPTQFNNAEDLEKYPRTLENDVEKIRTISDQILLYAPGVSDIYEEELTSETFDFGGIEHQMEGKFRPGHFDGVGTVVKKLFEIVKPTHAYFGEKDFQQLQIVRKLVAIEHLPVTIVACEIYREANGLAMSSRNERLSKTERESAAVIFKTLKEAKELFASHTTREVKHYVATLFDQHPNITLEYFEIADETTLIASEEKINGVSYRAFLAVFINNIRLIDTISL
jgi:pantoate--beta-alanine ligase